MNGKVVSCSSGEETDGNEEDSSNGSIGMVLLSTAVAVCGSFEFGSCLIGYSAPVQSAISEDLNLSLLEYSMFGSILTIGAMLGAVTNGRTADFIGRKGAMRMSAMLCIMGWRRRRSRHGHGGVDGGVLASSLAMEVMMN
ncbi:unnamed protein product [Linum trigynum]|uniref:Major facilitator superfamily (MFS) profile domain-containing protein n=1 Tax=Linum trigynum TaxID=586398 RepID=A0AAV2D6B2_9ROSI